MKRIVEFSVLLLCLSSAQMFGQARTHIVLQVNGWTIDCQPESASLTISAARLGILVRDVQLNESTPSGLQKLVHFSARVSPDRQLMVETVAPKTAWVFSALPGKLSISTTDFQGILTGKASSSRDRTIAILLDRLGEPVQWQGTDETVQSYGGLQTAEQSFLPRLHPEVMHLGLGHVSGSGMHSLFDRETDITIDFGENAALQADAGIEDTYGLTIPVRDSAAIQLIPDYFTAALKVPFYARFDDTYSPSAPIVWSSWTS